MKIAVLGYSGSGKSTLADILAKRYALPCLHLDSVFWSAGWTEREHAEALRMVSDFLQKDHWVIDGNYRSLFQKERLADADQILLLQFPRFLCLYRAFKRFFQNRGTTRPDMAEGCSEKIDAEFVWWILYKGRRKAVWERYRKIREQYPGKVQVLKSSRQMKRYLNRSAGLIP